MPEQLPDAAVNLAALENGCYVDGHWGQYAPAHMCEQFDTVAYVLADDERQLVANCLASMGPSLDVFTDDEFESLVWLADECERMVGDALAEGRMAHWHDGEFFLSPYCGRDWPDTCEDDTCACHTFY